LRMIAAAKISGKAEFVERRQQSLPLPERLPRTTPDKEEPPQS